MTATKVPLLGTSRYSPGVMPGRSPGSLGWNDAADPSARACMMGDSQGPVGTNEDAGYALLAAPPMSCQMEVPVVAIDLDRMRRLLYATAYAEAADRAATRGFGSAEVTLGEQSQIEAEARNRTDQLIEDLHAAIEAGPEKVQAFIGTQELRKDTARSSLRKKFDAAAQAGKTWDTTLEVCVKSLSVIKFGSTVTIKTVSVFTPFAGTAIDVVYSGAQAAIKQSQSVNPNKTVMGVVVEETTKNAAQEVADMANELVASGVMTTAEKNIWNGTLGNYSGNSAKLAEKIEQLEEKLRKAVAAGKAQKASNFAAQHAKKLTRLKELRINTAKNMLGKGASATAKKVAGKTLSLVFLAQEVKEALTEMKNEWRESD